MSGASVLMLHLHDQIFLKEKEASGGEISCVWVGGGGEPLSSGYPRDIWMGPRSEMTALAWTLHGQGKEEICWVQIVMEAMNG